LAWGDARFLILPHCVNSQGEYDHAGGKLGQFAQSEG
jgi:hypothetical protein